MKARVKLTGALIDVIPKFNTNAQHSGDNLYVCDNMIFRGCDLDFLNVGNSIDWEQRRYEIAKSALSGILIGIAYSLEKPSCVEDCKAAVEYADELIRQLKGE
jgi:hypothetical protein